jgi:4-hydroxy-tetrahydrodipicolinate synthase
LKEWGRLVTAMVTPFDEHLNVDYERAALLAKKLVDEGTTALLVSGTTGESPTLSAEEKCELFRVVKEAVNVQVIAGVGTNNTKASIEMGMMAKSCGVDGILAVVPYYNKPPQEALFRHFKAIAEEVGLPMMLYNVPSRTSCNLEASTTVALSKVPHIAAIKEASGNLDQVVKIIKEAREGFLVYSGDDSLTLPILAIGGYGVVSTSSNVASAQMREMIDAFVGGDAERASKLHLKLFNLMKALFVTTNPIPVKAALNMLGFAVGGLRLPLVEANSEVEEVVKRALVELGLLK